MFFRGGFPSRRELLERLENYQRDLEQQLADVADVIAHLRDRDEGPSQPARARPLDARGAVRDRRRMKLPPRSGVRFPQSDLPDFLRAPDPLHPVEGVPVTLPWSCPSGWFLLSTSRVADRAPRRRGAAGTPNGGAGAGDLDRAEDVGSGRARRVPGVGRARWKLLPREARRFSRSARARCPDRSSTLGCSIVGSADNLLVEFG